MTDALVDSSDACLAAIDPNIRPFALQLWSHIPANGDPISNVRLRRLTRTVTNNGYTAARNALRSAELVYLGRGGRSGTVARLPKFVDGRSLVQAESKQTSLELSLYAAIVAQLRERVTDEYGLSVPPIVKITGSQGRRQTGGVWTRPDITVVTYRKFEVLAGGHLEVHTYEVKTAAGLDVRALHEARSHRRRAHRSYVLVDLNTEADCDRLLDLVDEARELGVGLCSFRSVEEDWEVWHEPPVHHPDPVELDAFLSGQLREYLDEMRGWAALPALSGTE